MATTTDDDMTCEAYVKITKISKKGGEKTARNETPQKTEVSTLTRISKMCSPPS